MIRPTVLARVPILLMDQAGRLGLRRADMMRAAGLTPQVLKDPDGRVPSLKQWKLWRYIIQEIPDVALGLKLADATASPVRFGLVGYTLVYSRTMGQALHRLERYSRIVAETIRVYVEKRGGRCRVVIDPDPRFDALRHPIDARLANILSTMRIITGSPVAPLEVSLPYSKLKDTSYHRHFFSAPLRFDEGKAALWFSPADMEQPVVHADETLVGYLDKLAAEKLRDMGGGTLAERVARALWSELGDGLPSIQRVAALLGTTPRTLQRQLRAQGRSYRQVQEQFRREMATELMHRPKMAVYEVAYLLGYADPSSFHRAFRRWHRKSPRAYRRAS